MSAFIEQLRDYQADAIRLTYGYMGEHEGKNPCIVLPTGAGKSWVIAGICENILRHASDAKILVLAHRRELLVQDAEKIIKAWPEAPVSIYCAGLGQHDIGQITVASIQSIARGLEKIQSKIDLTIVDEAHLIGKSTKQYKNVLDALYGMNANMRVIGLTATPYRLDQGRLDRGKDALFNTCIEPVGIQELIDRDCLVPLKSQFEEEIFDVSNVRKQGGDYVISDLEQAVNIDGVNQKIVREATLRGMNRKAWLFFCVSKAHAKAMCQVLRDFKIPSDVLLGDTKNRTEILDKFKSGEIRALTSVGVLTTGFDYPGIDMLVFARPTCSPGLYVQMAGRGMRPCPEQAKTDCLVLDYAGLVKMHGPITNVRPPRPKRPKKNFKECPECGKDDVPIAAKECSECGHVFGKMCPKCGADVPINLMICPECQHEFTRQDDPSKISTRFNNDIMGQTAGPIQEMSVSSWEWDVCNSKKDNIPMFRIKYYSGNFLDDTITEYLCVCHDGYAGRKAQKTFHEIINTVDLNYDSHPVCFYKDDMCSFTEYVNNNFLPPTSIIYRIEGQYPKVIERKWDLTQQKEA